MIITETERLVLRHMEASDAKFILRLVNEPSWLQYIGDRGVKTLGDAQNYIQNGPVDMYQRLGFGLYTVVLKELHTAIGICGLIKRDTLDDVDIGFALLPEFWGQGYAAEAARATMKHAKDDLALARVVAITSPDNHASGKLLEKLGFRFEYLIQQAHSVEKLKLYSCTQ